MQRQARDGVHQHRLAIGRTLARLALAVHRRFHVHERQRHELGEAVAFAPAESRMRSRWRAQCSVALDMAEHDGRWSSQADAVRRLDARRSHCSVFSLSGQITRRTSSSRISAAVPGKRAQPAVLEHSRETSPIGQPSVRAPCDTSSGENAWTCIRGTACLHGAADAQIGLAGVVGMDAALHADFGGAALPRFARAPRHFLQRRDRRARRAGSRCMLALGEGAEAGSGRSRCWCS